jgi:hypothetical protein
MSSNEEIPPEYFDRVPITTAPLAASRDERYQFPEYIVRRRILTLLGAALDIATPEGMRVLYCHAKPFRLKEDIRIYESDAKYQELLAIKARQWLDFSAAYDVGDAVTGEWVGTLKRCGWRSMVRDKWEIYDPSGVLIGTVEEDSWLLALLRRFLTELIPQSYDFRSAEGELLAEGKQFFNPFMYKLRLTLNDGYARTMIDRRLILAASMLLATIEGRQGG